MRKKLLIAGLFVASLAAFPISTGSNPALASSATIDTTGPGSYNSISLAFGWSSGGSSVENSTSIDFSNDSDQEANSGDSEVNKNTTGGDAETGDAMNDNSLTAGVMIDNSGSASSSSCGDGCGGDADVTIENTGPHSENIINVGGPDCSNSCSNSCYSSCGGSNGNGVENNTDISIDNDNNQEATTGDAEVYKNTTGGDAETGDASNNNETDVDVEIDNSGSHHGNSGCNTCGGDAEATIDTTGPESVNTINIGGGNCCGNGHSVNNSSSVDVSNDNNQSAQSGNATVSGNTTGGSASTGSASNSNSSSFSFSITN